jgi:hypothetical protein
MGNQNLWEFISTIVAQKPDVTDQEIADKLKVSVMRSSVDHVASQHAMKDLEVLRVSAVLESRVALHDVSEY